MNTYKAKFLERKDFGRFSLFTFERPSDFIFKSGQYISIIIGSKTRRPYSIASPDYDKNLLRLFVDLSPLGQGISYLKSLQVGNTISFIGPFGEMVLPSDFSTFESINFISTGSGLAPFLSLIPSLLEKKYSPKNIFLLSSFKESIDIYKPLFADKINTFITVTSPPIDNSYYLGRVTKYLSFIRPKNSLSYLCGNRQMIQDVKDYLIKHSCDSVRTEIFY